MAKKKEEVIEQKPETKESIEVTPEMIEQMSSEQNVFSYGLGEAILLGELESRIFYLDGEITPDTFREVTMFIVKANIQDVGIPTDERVPIKLVINSPGGSVLDGFALIDTIKASTTPVFGIVIGYAYSMALSVLISCDLRLATVNSSFLLHDGSTGLFDSSTKFRDTMKFYDKLDERVDKMIAAKTKLTMKELEDRKRQENFWFSDEAKDLGIIDGIIGEDILFDDIFCIEHECDCEECSCES